MENRRMTKIAESFLHAAEQLTREETSNFLTGTTLKRIAERIGGYKCNSILPSDYCYNYINKSRYSCRNPLFIWKARNKYVFIGADARYNGPLIWRKADGTEKQVGIWIDGILTMFEDLIE
jgi:hypothetical protein